MSEKPEPKQSQIKPEDVVHPLSWDALMVKHVSWRQIAQYFAAWLFVAIAAISLRDNLLYVTLFISSTIMSLLAGFLLNLEDWKNRANDSHLQESSKIEFIFVLGGVVAPPFIYAVILLLAVAQQINPIETLWEILLIWVMIPLSLIFALPSWLAIGFLGQALLALWTQQTARGDKKKE